MNWSSYSVSTEVNVSLYNRTRDAIKTVLGECRTEAWTSAGGQLGDVEVFATPPREDIPAGATRIPKTQEFSYRTCTVPGSTWPRPVLYARTVEVCT